MSYYDIDSILTDAQVCDSSCAVLARAASMHLILIVGALEIAMHV